MKILDYLRKILNKNTDAKKAKEYTLDESLHQIYNSEITRTEFVIRLRTYQVSPGWLEVQLLLAYDQLDEWKISVLLSCLGSKSIRQYSNQELAPILSFLCEIMENPRWGGLTEEIADAIGYFYLDKKALRSLVNVCVAATHQWDIRKAYESMYTMYLNGICTKAEIIAAFQEVIDCPELADEWSYLSSGEGFIRMIEKDSLAGNECHGKPTAH